jgi:hypothetical protein
MFDFTIYYRVIEDGQVKYFIVVDTGYRRHPLLKIFHLPIFYDTVVDGKIKHSYLLFSK